MKESSDEHWVVLCWVVWCRQRTSAVRVNGEGSRVEEIKGIEGSYGLVTEAGSSRGTSTGEFLFKIWIRYLNIMPRRHTSNDIASLLLISQPCGFTPTKVVKPNAILHRECAVTLLKVANELPTLAISQR